MAIKQQPVLTKEDFEAALVTLRMSVSEVARETGVPRHIVSHFRNYGDGLKPEQAAKLRDFLEDKGIEFTEDEAEPTEQQSVETASIPSLNPQLSVGLKVEHYFPISNSVPDDVVRDALYSMEENDARLVTLFQTELDRDDGFLGSGELTDESKAILQEAFALLAANYVTFRMLRGWPALNVKPTTEKPETVRDMILQTFTPQLVEAGLIADPALPDAETETEGEEA